MGDQPEFLPTRKGSTSSSASHTATTSIRSTAAKSLPIPTLALLENETVTGMDPNADYLTKRITEHAVSFIERNKNDHSFSTSPPDST